MRLLMFEKDLIIVEKNGKWYIPDKVCKLNPQMRTFVSEKCPEFDYFINDILKSDLVISKKYEEKIQWDFNFNVGFAYIPETGIMGII